MTDTGATPVRHPSLSAALSAFQEELPTIRKGNEAKVKSERTGAEYKYSYADLADVSEVVLPLLGKHGLSWTAQPTLLDDMFVLHYELKHESEESIEGIYPLPSWTTPPQQLGSAITYARRYALTAVTGVAPGGDDDDAQAAPAAAPAAASAKAERTRRTPAVKPAPMAEAATVDWAAQIIDAKTVEDLRAVYQLVEDKGEVGRVFDPAHAEHVAALAEFYGLDKPPATVKVGQMLGAVRKAIEERDATQDMPGEGELLPEEPAVEWPIVEPGSGVKS